MTDYVWPDDLVPWAQSFYLQPHVGGAESPFNRQRKVYELSAPRWVTRMSFRGGYDGIEDQKAYGPRLDALLAKLKGGVHRVAVYDFRRTDLRGTGRTVSTSNQAALMGSTSLTLVGLTPGSTPALVGDYIGGDGRPHIITEDMEAADAWGRATVTFEPPLGADIDGGEATLGQSTGMFRVTSDDAGENGVEVGNVAQYVVEMVEDLTDLAAFDPLSEFTGIEGAIYDLASWESTLFQDVDAETPVTASGQSVRCLRSVTGDTTWDMIWPGPATAPTFTIVDDVPRLEFDDDIAMYTRGLHPFSNPAWMVAGTNYTSGSGGKFVASKYSSLVFHIQNYTLGTQAGFIQNASPVQAPAFANSPLYSSYPDTEAVVDALLTHEQLSVRLNGMQEESPYSPIVSTLEEGDTVSDVMWGINIATQNALDPDIGDANAGSGPLSFFGGAILFMEPTDEQRDALVEYFKDQLEPEIRSTDIVILINGDSTSDDIDEASSDIGEEMFWRWADETGTTYGGEDTLRDLNPDASIFYRKFTIRGQDYGGWRKTQTGSGDRRIFVSNASVGGSQPSYHMTFRFNRVYEVHPHIDEHVWNHGHNMPVNTTDSAGLLRLGEWLDAMDKVRIHFPDAAHIAIRTHPHRTNETMEPVVEALDNAADLYGDVELVDIYEHFDSNGRPVGWYNADNVHIDIPDGVDEQLEIFVPTYANWVRPGSTTPALILETTDANLLTNGDFADFTGAAPAGWTQGGSGATVSKDTSIVDYGQDHSVKLTQAAGSGYISQAINATPYQGQTLVLAVRQYIVSGGGPYAGRIQMTTNGTGAVNPSFWLYDSTSQPVDGWRWAYLHVPVPADATTATVYLFAAGDAAGTVYYGRAILRPGEEPKDLAD